MVKSLLPSVLAFFGAERNLCKTPGLDSRIRAIPITLCVTMLSRAFRSERINIEYIYIPENRLVVASDRPTFITAWS